MSTREEIYKNFPIENRRDFADRPKPVSCVCTKCQKNKIHGWKWTNVYDAFCLSTYCKECQANIALQHRQRVVYTLNLKGLSPIPVSYSIAANWKRKDNHGYQLGSGEKGTKGLISACKHYETLWNSQNGLCSISGFPLKYGGQDFDSAVIDHNHFTGEIRGLVLNCLNILEGHLISYSKKLNSSPESLAKKISNYINS